MKAAAAPAPKPVAEAGEARKQNGPATKPANGNGNGVKPLSPTASKPGS